MFQFMRFVSRHSIPSIALLIVVAAPLSAAYAQSQPPVVPMSDVRKPIQSPADAKLIAACTSSSSAAGDGVPRGDPPPDGLTSEGLPFRAMTTPDQADLSIARVEATLETKLYSVHYCIVNRGGKPAFSPTTVRIQAGDVSVYEQTIFVNIPALSYNCLHAARRAEQDPNAKMTVATIEVTAAAGETSLLNNVCRIQWVVKG